MTRSARGIRREVGTRSPVPTSERVIAWLLRVVVVGSVLAIGSVHVPAVVAVGIVIFGGAAIAIWTGLLPWRLRALPGPVIALLLLVAYTLLQATPFPYGLLRRIAPVNADVWGRALLPFGEPPPAWATISLDPGASRLEALKWSIYAGVFALAAALGARRRAAPGILVVFISAVLTAMTTVAHGLLGAKRVFGLYEPSFPPDPWHVGPLLNSNNLAGYLNLGVMCGLGLMLMQAPMLPPWLVGLGVANVVGVAAVSTSRAAFLALPIGMGLLVVLLSRYDKLKRPGSVGPTKWLLIGAVGGGSALAMLGGTADTWRALYDKNLDKIAMLLWTRPVIASYPWFGIGRGAFESVFPAYSTVPGNIVFTHAENFPAQWVSEWGLPVGGAALVGLVWALRPKHVAADGSRVAAAAWAGLCVVLLQNFVDLALEVPGVCIAFCMVFGSLWGHAHRHLEGAVSQEAADSIMTRPRLAGVVACVIGAILIPVAAWGGANDVASEKASLHALSGQGANDAASRARFLERLRGAMLRHPAEPYFAFLGAHQAHAAHENPMPWIQRSLERGLVNGPTHLLLAEVLGARNAKRQAMFELKLALIDDPSLDQQAAQVAARLSKSFDDLMLAVPPGEAGVKMLQFLATNTYDPSRSGLMMDLSRAALERDPGLPGLRIFLAQDRIRHLSVRNDPADLCFGERRGICEAEVEEQARALARIEPNGSSADQVRAQLLLAQGRAVEADDLLVNRCPEVTDRISCLVQRARIDVVIGESERLNKTIKDLLVVSCGTPKSCAHISAWVGDLMAARGDWGSAVNHYRRATRDDPSAGVWQKLAEAASHAGSHGAAVEALERVAQLRGTADEALKAAIARERELAVGTLLRPR